MTRTQTYLSPSRLVYLSGPILGCTYDDARFGWRKEVADKMAPGIQVLSPMRQEGHLAEQWGKKAITDCVTTEQSHFMARPKSIYSKDLLDVKMCDIMLLNLMGATVVSRGSLVELGWASAFGKHVITCMEDTGNCHDHPFIREASAMVLNNIDDACDCINSLLIPGV